VKLDSLPYARCEPKINPISQRNEGQQAMKSKSFDVAHRLHASAHSVLPGLGAAVLGAALGLGACTAANAASAAPAAAAETQTIDNWVSCKGTTDDTAGVAKALAAARNGAFTLIVDCPVNIKIGTDIARPLFIDNGTTIEFTGAGKFIVDNVQIPAFVIADSSNITLTNWNVEYDASMPINANIGYTTNGQFNDGKAGNAFNDVTLTTWLAKNRAIDFGSAHSQWSGTTNACAVFYITGDSSAVNVTGMHLGVPAAAGGDHFIPVAFSLGMNFKADQTVNSATPMTSQYVAIPHALTFSNVTFDGTYMGWVGGVKDSVFENIVSLRYGDLQDADDNNVGGIGKWFAPPHLFYLNYPVAGDPALFNSNLQFEHVADHGLRVGKARDLGGADSTSGFANSLKLGCVTCSVDDYQSFRPDGFMDVLASNALTVSNVTATYNSAFTNNLYPGWRFPTTGYQNVTFENVSLKDLAAVTTAGPISNANAVGNQNMVFANVQVGLNKWGPSQAPFPALVSDGINSTLTYSMQSALAQQVKAQSGDISVILQAAPTTLRVGQTVAVSWLSWQANSCAGSASLAGASGTTGSSDVKMSSAGTQQFTLECRDANGTTSATVAVVVTP
jgi:hypothetical protein